MVAHNEPPTVVFIQQPRSHVIPWRGRSELRCKVNHSQAAYSWFVNQHAPIDVHYSNGRLLQVRASHEFVHPETTVVRSKWSHIEPGGGILVLRYPDFSIDRYVDRSTFANGRAQIPWVEGDYRCKAHIPGYGTLLSVTAHVRLTDLFLEPGLSISTGTISNHHDTHFAPYLGEGVYSPGEVVVLRCPVLAMSENSHIFRWFFQSKYATSSRSIAQELFDKNPSEINPEIQDVMQTIFLDGGRWLEIHLAQSKMRTTFDPGEDELNYLRTDLGFGEYFCRAHIPEKWGVDAEHTAPVLNRSGPYIRVDEATPQLLPTEITNLFKHTGINISWSIQPSILNFTELPPSRNLASRWSIPTSAVATSPELWRSIGDTVTLPCAVNLRCRLPGNQECGQGYISHQNSLFRSSKVNGSSYRVEWVKNNHSLDIGGSERLSIIGSASLVLKNIQLTDTGLYQCWLMESQEKLIAVSSSLQLWVGQAPKVKSSTPTTLSGLVQTEKNMSCSFMGFPEPTFKWWKNAEPVQNSDYFRISQSHPNTSVYIYRTGLSIRGLLPNDAGYFQCMAENRFGFSQFTGTLSVRSLIDATEQNLTVPSAPRNPKVMSLSESGVYLTWLPPSNVHSDMDLDYRLYIKPKHSNRILTMNTTGTGLLLTDLRPDSSYQVEIRARDVNTAEESSDVASLHVHTKKIVYRPLPVTDLTTSSNEFRTLNLSWRIPIEMSPTDESALEDTDQITHYLVNLFNLNPEIRPTGRKSKPIQLSVPVQPQSENSIDAQTYHYTVSNLEPDAFYQIVIQAVTASNVTGYPAVISSSARVKSKPPSAPPGQLHVQSIGAHVATVSWEPPPPDTHNGELILYQINISCEHWLHPRQISVSNGRSQLLRYLHRNTKYTLSVSAATRGGNGPDSSLIWFETRKESNQHDQLANTKDSGHVFGEGTSTHWMNKQSLHGGTVGEGNIASRLKAVENLHYIVDGANLLLLWSAPMRSRSDSTEVEIYVIKWGTLYPGPSSVTLSANATKYALENLEPDTSYLIDVTTVYGNGEQISSMLTARTKRFPYHQRLSIPLNVHVGSSEASSDSVLLMWDAPTCDSNRSIPRSFSYPLPIPECEINEEIKFYQVAYKLQSDVTSGDDLIKTDDGFRKFSEQGDDHTVPGQIINVTKTWVRLMDLEPGRWYSVVVRSVGFLTFDGASTDGQSSDILYSEWSMADVFRTPELKPADAPSELRLMGLPNDQTNGSYHLRVSWQPPQRPRGRLTGYLLYFSTNHTLPLTEWSTRELPPDGLNTVLTHLHLGSIYFIHMSARNQHGLGPLSELRLFRTPDVAGQGAGEIPVGQYYYGGKAIPIDLIRPHIQSDGDWSRTTGTNGTTQVKKPSGYSWILVGTIPGVLIIMVLILSGLWTVRNHRPNLNRFPKYQRGSNVNNKLRPINELPNDSSDDQMVKQVIVMKNTNDEVLFKSINRQKEALTTSAQLNMSTPTSILPTENVTPYYLSRTNDPQTTGSWDRDSDSLHFISVSRNQPDDNSFQATTAFIDPVQRANQTPTRTASLSSNSCAGSHGTPSRRANDPTYQTHKTGDLLPNYASATMGTMNSGPPPIRSRSPPNIPHPSLPVMMHYYQHPQQHQPGIATLPHMAHDRGQIVSLQFVSPYLNAPSYSGPILYNMETGMPQQPIHYPVNLPVNGIARMNLTPATPRVNAADLLSFTSSDDIRPVMSASIHNEDAAPLAAGSIRQAQFVHQECNDIQRPQLPQSFHVPLSDFHNGSQQNHNLYKQLPQESTINKNNYNPLRSPHHRPTTNKSKGPQNAIGTMQSQLHTAKEAVVSEQNGNWGDKSSHASINARPNGNGDGSEDKINNAFSSEELSQEMANLEGLMKDLTAITKEDFSPN